MRLVDKVLDSTEYLAFAFLMEVSLFLACGIAVPGNGCHVRNGVEGPLTKGVLPCGSDRRFERICKRGIPVHAQHRHNEEIICISDIRDAHSTPTCPDATLLLINLYLDFRNDVHAHLLAKLDEPLVDGEEGGACASSEHSVEEIVN